MEVATQNVSDSGLSIRELEAQITELAGHLNAANHRWLVLIAEFDRRQGWSDGFTQSCAHWLSWKCGLDLGAAREKVRVAHALESLPTISAAMGGGQLSYSKVRALTRVATPANQDVLLNVALHGTTHHVETLVRQFRRVQEVEELSREALQHSQRRLTYFHDHDGSLVVKLQLTAESGALFLKAIEAALPEIPLPDDCKDSLHVSGETPATCTGGTTTAAARRADALVVLAESFLQHGAAAMKGGDRQQIVVHVDDCTLRQRSAGRCELDDGPAIPVETARRLACDASTVTITEDEQGEPLDVGRKTRSIPPALRRALARATKAAFSPVAATSGTSTGTTSSIGRRAVRRNCLTWPRCAGYAARGISGIATRYSTALLRHPPPNAGCGARRRTACGCNRGKRSLCRATRARDVAPAGCCASCDRHPMVRRARPR